MRVESTTKGVKLVADDGTAVEVGRAELEAVMADAKRAAVDLAELRLAVVEAAMAEPLDALALHQATSRLLGSIAP